MNEQTRLNPLGELLTQKRERVQKVLNILLESPYFYRGDCDEAFCFLRRYKHEFSRFFEEMFGWELMMDGKCARVYKSVWHNPEITPTNRDVFHFNKKNEQIAFMLLLEFFERQIERESISVEDQENLRFRFGELLHTVAERFRELYPQQKADFTEELVRAKILRPMMPQLEKYRFLKRIKPPKDELITPEDTIYEALPALYHYNVTRLSRPIEETGANDEKEVSGVIEK